MAESSRGRLSLVLGGLGLGFVILEVVLALVLLLSSHPGAFDTATPAESMRWVPHPFQPFAGRPNASFQLRNDDGSAENITTNAEGFRTHEFPDEKQPGDFVVVCLGGSTTYGFKVDGNANTWPERLEAMLAERYPERRVRVYNLGVDMATTAVSLVNLALHGIRLDPDLIIVYHGYNDLDALGAVDFRTDHAHFYRDIPTDVAATSYQARLPRWLRWSFTFTVATGALDRASGVNDLAVAAQMPRHEHADPLFGFDAMLTNLDSIRSVASGRGAQTIFATFQFRDGEIDPLIREFNDALRAFFAHRGYDYVDQDALMPDLDATLQVDPCHFTQKGRDMMARNYFTHIVERGLLEPGEVHAPTNRRESK